MTKISVTINAESAEELKQILGNWLGELNSADPHHVQQPQQPINTAVQQVPTAVPTTPVAQQVPIQSNQAPQQTQSVQPAQPVPTAPQNYTLEDLARAATPLNDAGRNGELVALLASFGIQTLQDLPQEQYGVFATKLREMGARI